jgi:hypothetical protein
MVQARRRTARIGEELECAKPMGKPKGTFCRRMDDIRKTQESFARKEHRVVPNLGEPDEGKLSCPVR